MISAEGMLEIPEVAKRLGVAEVTLQAWRKKSINIPFYRMGAKRVLYREDDVQNFIESCRVEITHVEVPGGEQ